MNRLRKWGFAALTALTLAAPLASAAKANEVGPPVPRSERPGVPMDGPFYFWADARDDAERRQREGFHTEIIVDSIADGTVDGKFYVHYWKE